MAKGIYDKKRPTPKKVSSFDTKIIWIVVIAVAIITAGVLAAVLIDADARSFVGKVDGKRVPAFEYRLFLESAISEMNEEARTSEDYDEDAFWTDEKKQEACDKAIKDASEFYGEYRVAVKNGCDVTKEEKTNISNNLNYALNLYYQVYGNQYSIDQLVQMATRANITYEELGDYEKFLYKQAAIGKYRDKLEEGYKLEDLYYKDEDGNVKSTGEDAVLDEYNANRDDYRRIDLTSLVFKKDAAPVKPTEVKEPVKPETTDENSSEYVQYSSDLKKYQEYLDDLEKYEEDLKAYNEKNAETRAKVAEIFDALAKNGKYTGKGITEVATGEKDEDDKDVTAIPDYTDATIEDIAAKEGAMYASEKGANTFTGEPSSTDFLARFAHSIEWEDDSRTAVISTLVKGDDPAEDDKEEDKEADKEEGKEEANEDAADEENGQPAEEPADDTSEPDAEPGDSADPDKEPADDSDDDPADDSSDEPAYVNDFTLVSITENGAFKETELKLFEDDSYFYITKVTGILDIYTSTEEAPAASEETDDSEEAEEEAELSVRATVLNTLKSVKSDDDVKKEVADAGAKYDMKGVKQRVVDIVRKKVFG